MKQWLLGIVSLLLTGCLGYPDTVKPVENFEVDRYLGKWHEIARLDHPFERGLVKVSAEYSQLDNGALRVHNRGYAPAKGAWSEATGKALFVEDETTGYLKVSFFGPFYGSYVIFDMDKENYQWAFVTGPDRSYLWLLARRPTVDDALKERFTSQVEKAGYDLGGLIWTSQAD